MLQTSKTVAFAAVCVAVMVTASASVAQASEQEIVKFRLTKWKAAHFDDAKSAQKHHDTLKTIGCEAKLHKHKGHYDVSYRCSKC